MRTLKTMSQVRYWASRLRSAFDTNNLSPAQSPFLSKADVLNCYRYLLGREPENDQVITETLMHHSSFQQLRRSFLRSAEFGSQYKALEYELSEPTFLSRARPTIAFIHLLKTAGTTLNALLAEHFQPDRICPIHDNRLDLYPLIELSQFDLFSGHFDWFSVDLIPRERIKRVAVFRSPKARLLSFYRFLKSHSPGWVNENNVFVRLVHTLTAEEFFEHPFVRSSPEIYNHYLLVFGLAYAQASVAWGPIHSEIGQQVMGKALDRVRSLDGLGLTERFNESVVMIFRTLQLPIPSLIPKLQVTDNLTSAVEPVIVTRRLARALEELTVYDDLIYCEAQKEFERRSQGLVNQG